MLLNLSFSGFVQVMTTIKTRGKRPDPIIERPRSRQENLTTLTDMKTLQTKLKPTDLQWTS